MANILSGFLPSSFIFDFGSEPYSDILLIISPAKKCFFVISLYFDLVEECGLNVFKILVFFELKFVPNNLSGPNFVVLMIKHVKSPVHSVRKYHHIDSCSHKATKECFVLLSILIEV
jgi:hypothetical protein